MAYTKRDIESKELLVIKRVEPSRGERYAKAGYIIRVVQWIFEGKGGAAAGSTTLEKRELYLTEDDEVRQGKAKGFLAADLRDVAPRWDEVMGILENPPAPAFAKPAPKPEETLEQEEF